MAHEIENLKKIETDCNIVVFQNLMYCWPNSLLKSIVYFCW